MSAGISLGRVEWLPHDFTGVRSPREAEHDLLVVAGAGAPLDEAHVSVDPDDGAVVKRTGHVTAEPREHGRITVLVDGVALFEFDRQRCRGAWLSTLDGADYYSASIDLGWGCVTVSDGYNGL